MSRKAAWAVLLSGVLAAGVSPDAAFGQRRVRIKSVEIAPADAAIQVGRPQVFFCTAYDAANNPVPTATCAFTSSNRNVATVDSFGIATGVGAGTTIITARTGTGATAKSAAATLTVVGAAAGLTASRARVGLGVGERFPVSVRLLDERRRPIGPFAGLSWTSSNDSVARYVDGQVRGLRVGRARLTARTPWDSTVSVDVFVAGQLLVGAYLDGEWNLYALTAETVPHFVRQTSDSVWYGQAVFSTDLTRLAYVLPPSEGSLGRALFVANADGSEPRRLTDDDWEGVSSPVFVRPLGERVVFDSRRPSVEGGRSQLYIIGRDGTGRRQLTGGGFANSQPDVSPDGRKLLFVSVRRSPDATPRNSDIWEMNLDGTGERRLTSTPWNEESPQFAPDGRSFYFLREESRTSRVYRMSLTGTTATARPVTPVGVYVVDFSVSPDGSRMVLEDAGVTTVPRVVLFTMATGAIVPMRLGPRGSGTGQIVEFPVFRPATPRPR